MNPLTLEQIRIATNAKLIGSDPTLTISTICTDTRHITPGCLFIALKGENHDGHDHIQTATDAGALAAMVDRDVSASLPLIRVDNTRIAMGRLANHVRRQLKCKVIAVAGSNGKTGTKNLIHAALKNCLEGTISPKSFNNDIGVPTTIFAASPTDDYLVLEIGTNHPGEVLNLTKIAKPDIAIITNIGAEHLEFLGDLDGVTNENAQIIAGLNPRGLLILNGDKNAADNNGDTAHYCADLQENGNNGDSPLYLAVSDFPGRKITFGFDGSNDLFPTHIRCTAEGIYFDLEGGMAANSACHGDFESGSGGEIYIPLMGRHTAVNALAAIAVARELGVEDRQILAGLATATGPEMRLQMQTAGSVRILNDAYNANPHSMQAALETIRDMQSSGRKIAILGDMRELGPVADRYHLEIGRFAADCGLDQLVCIGEKAKLIADAATESGMEHDSVQRFANAGECAANMGSIISEDDLVLLKASRGMKLETVATAIISLVAGLGLRRQLASRTRRVIKRPATPVSKK
jgi:UDP-N-acetylmuramoyl-tripeptide--D-alanyl-D-alanine ligase